MNKNENSNKLLINKKLDLEHKLKEKNEILRKLKMVKQYKSRVCLIYSQI
jgi:hypothetical protein